MPIIRLLVVFLGLLPALLLSGGCDRRIYLRDGVTDGDTFYILPAVINDESPVTQSWVAYSLSVSTCQLEMGGPNPARNSSFLCEFWAREILTDHWRAYRNVDGATDDYLDTLLRVRELGFLDEYVWTLLRRPGWAPPDDLQIAPFEAWRTLALDGHEVVTKMQGSWIYQSDSSAGEYGVDPG